jgi:hypothetical protein
MTAKISASYYYYLDKVAAHTRITEQAYMQTREF